ncbi:hypothetical protein BWI93_03910 [Siphonobacter sp. BAB-5385]|uniref:S8 family serine peptidase n=2 Tax=unclassified Siphonobacter TaxID=2635712 RepID=UPI000B9E7A1F|nr:S8 family serine peptidase [Siphonobacter sp. BAB-5385]OZI09460.1 hypothetical protein BWI93_03910 [Siphonobacter sp. BAB-5385]
MKHLYFFGLTFLGLSVSSMGQQLTQSDKLRVLELSKEFRTAEDRRILEIKTYLRSHPHVRQSYVDATGAYVYLHSVDAAGNPLYYKTRSNIGLAKSIKTDKLWNGGGLGLDLQGQGMEVSSERSRLGVWEPNPVRTSHQEFGGRAVTRDTPLFSQPDANGGTDHAAHVAATMVAAGINADAKGMAHQARIDCYEVQSDEKVEMNTAAAAGMLVSNHSYGPKFAKDSIALGVYTSECREFDQIAYGNKYYLQFHAAGNDRDESEGIKYDILIGSANAKNIVAIGAVKILANGYKDSSSVEIADFSSFGPTDDGRVKPDLVAPGVSINSASSQGDNLYKVSSGTSMASPGAAASLFLLQQHHKNVKGGVFMKAATLKGLGIHTADETGSAAGPDYSFGWGLINMERAIQVINNPDLKSVMEEAVLGNGATYRKEIKTGGGPFKATLCWTDPAGTPVAPVQRDNRTPMLVNDLDLRLINAADHSVVGVFPWKLNPDAPTAAATRGDNVVDNVEQIYVDNLPEGTYYLQVTHKGSLQEGTVFNPIARTMATQQEFSIFSTDFSAKALPVTLVRFDARCRNQQIQLDWRTAAEQQVSHFDLQYSSDSKSWENVGRVPFQKDVHQYSFSKAGLAMGYYRLVSVDVDGRQQSFRAQYASCTLTQDQVYVYPNPVTDILTLESSLTAASDLDLRVYTAQGLLLKSERLQAAKGTSQIPVTLKALQPGIYLVYLSWNQGSQQQVFRIIKN